MDSRIAKRELRSIMTSTHALDQLDEFVEMKSSKLQLLNEKLNITSTCEYTYDTRTRECVIKGSLIKCLSLISNQLNTARPKRLVDTYVRYQRDEFIVSSETKRNVLFLDAITSDGPHIHMIDEMRKLKQLGTWFNNDHTWGYGFLIIYMMALGSILVEKDVGVIIPENCPGFSFTSATPKHVFVLHRYDYQEWGLVVHGSDKFIITTQSQIYCDDRPVAYQENQINTLVNRFMRSVMKSAFNISSTRSQGNDTFLHFYQGKYIHKNTTIYALLYDPDEKFDHGTAMTKAMIRPYVVDDDDKAVRLYYPDFERLMETDYITYRYIVVRIYQYLVNIRDKSRWATVKDNRTYLLNVLNSCYFILSTRDTGLLSMVSSLIFDKFLINEFKQILTDTFMIDHASFMDDNIDIPVYMDDDQLATMNTYMVGDIEMLVMLLNFRHIPKMMMNPFYFVGTLYISPESPDSTVSGLHLDHLFVNQFKPKYQHYVILIKHNTRQTVHHAVLVINHYSEQILYFDVYDSSALWNRVQKTISQLKKLESFNLIKCINNKPHQVITNDDYVLYYILLCIQIKKDENKKNKVIQFVQRVHSYGAYASPIYYSVLASANALRRTPQPFTKYDIISTPILTNWSFVCLLDIPYDESRKPIYKSFIVKDIKSYGQRYEKIQDYLSNADISPITTMNPVRQILRLPQNEMNLHMSIKPARPMDKKKENMSPYKHVIVHVDNLSCVISDFLVKCSGRTKADNIKKHHKGTKSYGIIEDDTCMKVSTLAYAGRMFSWDYFDELICVNSRMYEQHIQHNAASNYLWKNKNITRLLIARVKGGTGYPLTVEDIKLFISHPLLELLVLSTKNSAWCIYRIDLGKPVPSEAASLFEFKDIPHYESFNLSISKHDTELIGGSDKYITMHYPSQKLLDKVEIKQPLSGHEIRTLAVESKLPVTTMIFLSFTNIKKIYSKYKDQTVIKFKLQNDQLCKYKDDSRNNAICVGVFIESLWHYPSFYFILQLVTKHIRVIVFSRNYILYFNNFSKRDVTIYSKPIYSLGGLHVHVARLIAKRWRYDTVRRYKKDLILTI